MLQKMKVELLVISGQLLLADLRISVEGSCEINFLNSEPHMWGMEV